MELITIGWNKKKFKINLAMFELL